MTEAHDASGDAVKKEKTVLAKIEPVKIEANQGISIKTENTNPTSATI